MSAGTPTLDQLRVLLAVADSGSFSAAAKRLNRAQSVVSYTIANLESQLGLTLFARGHRRPVLTEAGRAVLADARRISRIVDELRARASGLTSGLEAEVALAVDVMFPTADLVTALEAFARAFPTVAFRLRVEALGAVVQLVLQGACSLGISGPMGIRLDGLERRLLRHIDLVPVVAPGHRLAALPTPLPAAAFHEHTQLVLSDRSPLTDGQDFGVISVRTWRLGDLGAKHALLRAGLGWGNMPEHMVRDDLASGRLVRLLPVMDAVQRFPLLLIHRAAAPPGPAAQWLADRLAGAAAEEPLELMARPGD
ncbi:MAG: LysR family transcriptional regulator [Rhodospirillales bacterium]|nr:LysR family transcriptional regulator [Rhodospirillales bacterium]